MTQLKISLRHRSNAKTTDSECAIEVGSVAFPGMSEDYLCEPVTAAVDVGALYLFMEHTPKGEQNPVMMHLAQDRQGRLRLIPSVHEKLAEPVRLSSNFRPIYRITHKVIRQKKRHLSI